MLIIKKRGAHFNKTIAAYRQRGLINQERNLLLKTLKKNLTLRTQEDPLKKTHSLRNLKKTLITENSTKDPITNNLGEISTLMNFKRTLSLRTLRSFRTLNDSWATKKSFYDDISQSETFLHQNICIF